MPKKIWLTITGVELRGAGVRVQVQGDTDVNWLPAKNANMSDGELFNEIKNALNDSRMTVSGKLKATSGTTDLNIEDVRFQYK